MSKIGKKPISVPEKVAAKIESKEVTITGPLGELRIPILDGIEVAQDDSGINLNAKNNTKQSRSNWGTLRSLIANAVEGVTKGFEKTLLLEGVGYKIEQKGSDLIMALGFSHSVEYKAPEGISFEVEKNASVKVKGTDKFLVGQTAAEIRALKKPEPYKGKGFRYSDEVIRRKAGKKAVTAAA